MANESGDMKFLGNFRKLIDLVKDNPAWNPSYALLDPVDMEAQYADALAAVEDLPVKIAPLKVAVNEREAAYEEMDATVRDARRLLKASGASQAMIDDANTFANKALGKFNAKKPLDDPNTPVNEAAAAVSNAQLSFDNKLGNYRGFVEMLANEPLYAPNETHCTVGNMNLAMNKLETLNNNVSATSVPVGTARADRDDKLYLAEDSIFVTQSLAKKYASVVFKNEPATLKAIAALKFKKPGSK